MHVVSQRARVLRLRRTDCSLAFIASNRVAFLHQERVGILILRFSKLNPGPPIPLSTLQATPRDAACKTEGQDGVAVSFLVGLFHSLQHAGLTRRTLINAVHGEEVKLYFKWTGSQVHRTLQNGNVAKRHSRGLIFRV